MSFEKLLTAKDVSEILQIDVQRVYELTRRNLLSYIKLGERQYRYSPKALEQFIESGGNRPDAPQKANNSTGFFNDC